MRELFESAEGWEGKGLLQTKSDFTHVIAPLKNPQKLKTNDKVQFELTRLDL